MNRQTNPIGPILAACAVLGAAACATTGSIGSAIPVPGLGGSKLTDEEQITLLLDDVEEGMERRRIFKVLAHLSRNYQDSEGRDYDGMTKYLQAIFERYRDIRITRTRPIIRVNGVQATAVETFGTLADPVNREQDIPIHIQGQVTVYLEKAGEQWLITKWGQLR